MKTIAVIVAMLLGAFTQAQVERTGNISAIVSNVNGSQGSVVFGLYDADNFMKSAPNYSVKTEIRDGKAIANFKEIPQGTYALLVMHDKNNNERMDFDSNGMPLEDYGYSGNSMSYGPPEWEASKFVFDGIQKELEIRF